MLKLQSILSKAKADANASLKGRAPGKRAELDVPDESSADSLQKRARYEGDDASHASRRAGREGEASQMMDVNESNAPISEVGRSRSTEAAEASDLSDEEVRRRLRTLGQPVTLFGEDAMGRVKRLLHAEATMHVEDEGIGAGAEGANVLIDIQKEERRRAASTQEAAAGPQINGSISRGQATPPTPRDRASGAGGVPAAAPDREEGGQDDALLRQFQEAAERLKRQRLPPEQRIIAAFKQYMAEWQADLDARPKELVNTTVGLQATNGYRQTARSFQTLFARLEAGEVHHEIVTSLVIILDAMEARNYQHANTVYLQLSIGNQQWPIGVTSIGIHERKAREKLSTYANPKSQAHIMNDEATRKYLHGVSRLIKAVQGLHPTDPSRSVNFNAVQMRCAIASQELRSNGVQHGGLGVKLGNQKEQLLQLRSNAEDPSATTSKSKPAPHYLADDGSVKVPTTWGSMLRASQPE